MIKKLLKWFSIHFLYEHNDPPPQSMAKIAIFLRLSRKNALLGYFLTDY
jgi:hypothetical protein